MYIRQLTAEDVRFYIVVEEDITPIRGNAMVSGDDEADRKCEDEILRRVSQGDVWAWGLVVVTAQWKSYEGSACLGACSFKSEDDFKENSGYYEDMKNEALEDLNKKLACQWETLKILHDPELGNSDDEPTGSYWV